MPARVRRVNRQSSSRLHIFFPHHSRATAPRDAASARHRSSSSPSTRICTVSSASRTRPNRAPTLPFFSFNATISRQDGESLVSLRSTRPRAPVRRPSPPPFASSFARARRIVSIIVRLFARLSRPSLARAIARASHRAHPLSSSPRAPPPFASTRASSRRVRRVRRPRARSFPSEPSRRWRFYLLSIARSRSRSRFRRAHSGDRSRSRAARARAPRPTDRRPPTADATRRGEATPRRRGGDGTRRDSATRSTASARANERERARTNANERERTRTNARSVRRPTDDARARDGASHRVPSRLDYPKHSRWIRWSGRRARDRTVRCTNGGMRR